jgi:predicted nucleotidyltransferase
MITENKTYNGWTNYPTWRVNLEIFDGYEKKPEYINADSVKELAEEVIFSDSNDSLAISYARAFLSDVNWFEIAEHLKEANTPQNI